MSLKTITTPIRLPSLSRIGAALSSIGHSLPSLAMSRVWLARPTIPPCLMALVTGLSTASRVSSFTMWNTSCSALPPASGLFQPVINSAVGFMKVTQARESVAITASPMLASMAWNHVRSWRVVAPCPPSSSPSPIAVCESTEIIFSLTYTCESQDGVPGDQQHNRCEHGGKEAPTTESNRPGGSNRGEKPAADHRAGHAQANVQRNVPAVPVNHLAC